MKTDVFQLSIIPIEDIIPHEEFDEKRTLPLVEKIKEVGFISNPILVAPLDDREEKYLQLDGMNRLSAFKKLGFKSIIAQIVDYNSQDAVELSSWVHMVNKNLNAFLQFLRTIKGCIVQTDTMESIGHHYVMGENLDKLCTIIDKKYHVYTVMSGGKLWEKVDIINKIVAYYHEKIIRDVLPQRADYHDVRMMFHAHTESSFMLIFPTFARHQIFEVVRKKVLFPSGITRHIINRRCLDLNLPLSMFDSRISVGEQNKMLENKLLRRSFRIYEEATVYFE